VTTTLSSSRTPPAPMKRVNTSLIRNFDCTGSCSENWRLHWQKAAAVRPPKDYQHMACWVEVQKQRNQDVTQTTNSSEHISHMHSTPHSQSPPTSSAGASREGMK
jgi:hypothetical protein